MNKILFIPQNKEHVENMKSIVDVEVSLYYIHSDSQDFTFLKVSCIRPDLLIMRSV